MQEQNVLRRMESSQDSMTKSEKKIAALILKNPQEAQYMSISTLAETCRVAEATVSRFCKTLGYDGYNDFKLALAKTDGNTASELGLATGSVTAADPVEEAAQKLFSVEIGAIRETLGLLNGAAITEAVRYLSGAQRVFCFGQGGSGIMAAEAYTRFSQVAPSFQWIQDSHLQAMAVSLCTVNDVILFFSYSGATTDICDLLRMAKAHGAKVILITHFEKCPATAYADVVLLCGSKETPLQTGSVAAKMGQLFLIDLLCTEYCLANPDFSNKNCGATAAAVASKLL